MKEKYICPQCGKIRMQDFPISDETGDKYCPDCNWTITYSKKSKYKSDVLDALNRIDELACDACQGTTSEEVQLEKDYNLVFDFINKRI